MSKYPTKILLCRQILLNVGGVTPPYSLHPPYGDAIDDWLALHISFLASDDLSLIKRMVIIIVQLSNGSFDKRCFWTLDTPG